MDTWGTDQGTTLPEEAAASSHCVFGKGTQRSDRNTTGVGFPGCFLPLDSGGYLNSPV